MRTTFLLLALGALPLAGQERFRFRYDPAVNRTVLTVSEMRTVTTMQGLPRVPDGASREVEARVFAHERVLGILPDGRRVAVGVDSVKVRQRENGAAWISVVTPPIDDDGARALVDERLHVVGIETTNPADGTYLRVLTAWSANLGFTFPDTAVTVGATFRTDAQLPFDVTLDDASGLAVSEVLLGELQFTLDSLVARPGDTLAYVRFAGAFTPRTIESAGEDGVRTDAFDGAFAGTLLWSTGWDAFVSGGVRLRVTGRLRAESAAGVVDATVDWDVTMVHRMRT